MVRIPLYRSDRLLADRSRYSGRVPVSPESWSFAPIAAAAVRSPGHPNLVEDQVSGSGDAASPDTVILAPAGSEVRETTSGGLALYLPGSRTGISAAEALTMSGLGQGGLTLAMAERIRALIDASGETQTDIATRAGMSRQTLQQILSGARPNPGIATVERLLAAMGRTLGDIG